MSTPEHTIPPSARGSSSPDRPNAECRQSDGSYATASDTACLDGSCTADCAADADGDHHGAHGECAAQPVDQLAAEHDRLASWISDLTTLHELTERLTRATSLDETLHETLRGGAALVGAQRGLIVLEPADGLGPEKTLGLGLGRADIGEIETVTDSSAFYGRLLDGLPEPGQPDEISHPDIAEEDGLDPRHREVAARLGYAASFAVPLVATTAADRDESNGGSRAPGADTGTTDSTDPDTDTMGPPDNADIVHDASTHTTSGSGTAVGARVSDARSAVEQAESARDADQDDGPSTRGEQRTQGSAGGQSREGPQTPQQQLARSTGHGEAGGRLGAVVWLYDEPAEPSERQRHLLALYLQCAAEHLARRLTLSRAEHVIETIGEELLPRRLPRVPGVRLAVRQHSGPRGGGDWYDALPLPEAALGLSVGGVTGSGPSAVAAMGRLRASLRAYAVMEGEDPVAVLSDLELLMRLTEPARSATALFGYAEPAARKIVIAGAGHCPPLIVGPRRCEFAETTLSAPLGMLACWEAPSVELTLAPGETLLLYTDGLLHRTGESVDRAFSRLHNAAVSASPAVRDDPDALVDHVLRKVLGDRRLRDMDHEEDVIILAARF